MLLLLYFIINIQLIYGFINFKFASTLQTNYKDTNEKITLKLPLKERNIVNQINGFYGLIGPNIDMNSNIDCLYELFTGDGIIQGVFFNNGNLTFVKHLIKTEKVLYEEINGKIPTNFMLTIFLLFLNKIKLFPNVMGMANTALLNVNNNNYALFERDHPYLLDINLQKKYVNTIKKIEIQDFEHFSGHSKMNNNGNLETLDYKIWNNRVQYYLLDNSFNTIDKAEFFFKYIPIIHDFYSNEDLLVLIDSPLVYKMENIFTQKIPIDLNYHKETYIYIYDKKTKTFETYTCETGFYIFHYAFIKDKEETTEIYASQYDKLDFKNINIKGSYRMIEINKKTKKVTIHKDEILENYNLDFPILFQDKVISRNFENRRINGFVITKDLKIYKELFYEDKHICGEHNIVFLNKTPYLIFFNIEINKKTQKQKNLLSLVNLYNYKIINIEINHKMNLGFHSIFIPNSLSN